MLPHSAQAILISQNICHLMQKRTSFLTHMLSDLKQERQSSSSDISLGTKGNSCPGPVAMARWKNQKPARGRASRLSQSPRFSAEVPRSAAEGRGPAPAQQMCSPKGTVLHRTAVALATSSAGCPELLNEWLLPVSLYPGGHRPAQAKRMDQPNRIRPRLRVLPTAQLRNEPFHISVTDTLSKLVTLAGVRKGLSFCSLLL